MEFDCLCFNCETKSSNFVAMIGKHFSKYQTLAFVVTNNSNTKYYTCVFKAANNFLSVINIYVPIDNPCKTYQTENKTVCINLLLVVPVKSAFIGTHTHKCQRLLVIKAKLVVNNVNRVKFLRIWTDN